MSIGPKIRELREKRLKLGRAAFARMVGISTGHLKNIEVGKRRPSSDLLKRIALAVGVDIDELARELQQDSKAGVSKLRVIDAAGKDHETSPEYWIYKGEELGRAGRSDVALEYYKRAEQLMSRKDYSWARLIIEKAGQALINLNDFEGLDLLLGRVEEEYQKPFELEYGKPDRRIEMLLEEKREWESTWKGDVGEVVEHGKIALHLAKNLKDEKRVEATALHFMGRSICEALTTFMLYEKLFPRFVVSGGNKDRLRSAATILSEAGQREKTAQNALAEAFSAQWEARARRALASTDLYEARQLERKWQAIFSGEKMGAEATLDLAKIRILEDDPRSSFGDAKDLLSEIIDTFSSIGYAPGLAEALTIEAYVVWLEGTYRTVNKKRHLGADSCIAAILLHPYGEHPNHKVGKKLLEIFVGSMAGSELEDYSQNLAPRLLEGQNFKSYQNNEPFHLLRFAFTLYGDFIERAHSALHQATASGKGSQSLASSQLWIPG